MRNKFDSCFSRVHSHWATTLLLPSHGPSSSLPPSPPRTFLRPLSPNPSGPATTLLAAVTNASDSTPSTTGTGQFVPQSTGVYPLNNSFTGVASPRLPLELSVAIPVYNAGPYIASLISSIDQITQIKYEVFCINGASTDDSPQIISQLEETRPGLYNIQMLYPAPAGFLRNLVIPLFEGAFAFFLDADDSVDGLALESATQTALRTKLDALMLPYQLAFVSQHGQREVTTLMGMDKYDHTTWTSVVALESSNTTRNAAMRLVNYPWNRLIRSDLLHAKHVFFGTTLVQNDVQYHWHGLSAAKRVAFLAVDAAPVCYHKKFVGTARMQLTKIRSAARMEMFWALQATHRVLCLSSPKPFEEDPETMQFWQTFVKKTIDWARNSNLVPAKSMPEFLRARARMIDCAGVCAMSCLYAHWIIDVADRSMLRMSIPEDVVLTPTESST